MKVRVEQFEGPLDLLLKLIEEEKLDITEISLARVTEQFLEHMRSLSDVRPRELSDWLAVAAKLLVIKSRALLPLLDFSEEEEEDAAGLAWQLYQYKRYKEAAKYLDHLQKKNKQSFGRNVPASRKIVFYPDPAVNPAALRDAMYYLAKTLAKIEQVPRRILEEVVTISEKIEELQNRLSKNINLKMRGLVESSASKTEIIVTFLALLELVKQKILTVEQEEIFADIIIKRHS